MVHVWSTKDEVPVLARAPGYSFSTARERFMELGEVLVRNK